MSQPHPWTTEETTEIQTSESVEIGQVERYGVFYPYDGFFSGGLEKEAAEGMLSEARRRKSDAPSQGAYIVKYSIERVED